MHNFCFVFIECFRTSTFLRLSHFNSDYHDFLSIRRAWSTASPARPTKGNWRRRMTPCLTRKHFLGSCPWRTRVPYPRLASLESDLDIWHLNPSISFSLSTFHASSEGHFAYHLNVVNNCSDFEGYGWFGSAVPGNPSRRFSRYAEAIPGCRLIFCAFRVGFKSNFVKGNQCPICLVFKIIDLLFVLFCL